MSVGYYSKSDGRYYKFPKAVKCVVIDKQKVEAPAGTVHPSFGSSTNSAISQGGGKSSDAFSGKERKGFAKHRTIYTVKVIDLLSQLEEISQGANILSALTTGGAGDTFDVYHTDLRRARSATSSMIPTKTGAASAVGLVLPELNGKLDGFAMRVPTINVSIVDLSFVASRDTSVEEVNGLLKEAAASSDLKGILDYSEEPLVSVDYNHTSASSTVDSGLTKVSGRLVKVCSWYDNEWGFSNRMLDTTVALMSAK